MERTELRFLYFFLCLAADPQPWVRSDSARSLKSTLHGLPVAGVVWHKWFPTPISARLAVCDMVLEYWFYKNANETYLEYLAEHNYRRDFGQYVSEALPGAALETCVVQGYAYQGRSKLHRVWFAPDELLEKLRLLDSKLWDSDVAHRKSSQRWDHEMKLKHR
jgi:hypothetical protein